MASSVLANNNLVVRYQVGVNEAGKDVFKQQNFKKISPLATEEEMVELADLVNEVIDFTVSEIRKEQTFILSRI